MSAFGLILDGLVAVLLAATIYYAIVLNRRLAAVRDREAELQSMIAEFNQAAVAAEGSAATLQVAGANAEQTLRAAIDDSELATKRLRLMARDAEELAERLFKAGSSDARRDTPENIDPVDAGRSEIPEQSPRVSEPAGSPAAANVDKPDFTEQPEENQPGEDEPVDPRVRAEQVVLEAIRSSGLGR